MNGRITVNKDNNEVIETIVTALENKGYIITIDDNEKGVTIFYLK